MSQINLALASFYSIHPPLKFKIISIDISKWSYFIIKRIFQSPESLRWFLIWSILSTLDFPSFHFILWIWIWGNRIWKFRKGEGIERGIKYFWWRKQRGFISDWTANEIRADAIYWISFTGSSIRYFEITQDDRSRNKDLSRGCLFLGQVWIETRRFSWNFLNVSRRWGILFWFWLSYHFIKISSAFIVAKNEIISLMNKNELYTPNTNVEQTPTVTFT